jgi:bifunctional non-homologous end joining protein LigD
MVFDLDPSGDSFGPVKATAQSLKELLDGLGLPPYLKTTGSRGLHVAVPLRRSEEFDSVRAFAREVAKIVVSQDPGQRTLEQRKSRRRGRVFVDVNRNAFAQLSRPSVRRARPPWRPRVGSARLEGARKRGPAARRRDHTNRIRPAAEGRGRLG